MRLASCLIRVGMPYISSFLPSKDKDFWRTDGEESWPKEIPLNLNPSQRDVREAEEDLGSIAKDVKWCLNDIMYAKWGYMGLTRIAEPEGPGEPWEILDVENIETSDTWLKAQGKQRRPLLVGIMEEYLNAIKTSDPASEQHIRATFMAGITMAHEVGHVIFLNDFRSFNSSGEPHVGDGCEAELGFSFICWIFSGFHPQNTLEDIMFKHTLSWEPQYTLSMKERPLYKTYYSIPISYMERVLSQEFWDSLGPPDQLCSERARKALRPNTDGKDGLVATATKPNWEYSHLKLMPLWTMRNNFKMPGFEERNKITDLTEKEIQYEYETTKDLPINRMYACMSQMTRDSIYQTKRALRGDFDAGEPELEELMANAETSKTMIPKPSRSPKPQNPLPTFDDSDDDSGRASKRPKSMSQSRPPKRPRIAGPTKEIIDLTKETTGRPKEVIDLTRETADLTIDEEPGGGELPSQVAAVARLYHRIAARAAALDAIINEPRSGPRKRPKHSREMMEELEDYIEVIDLEEKLEMEQAGAESGSRYWPMRRAARPLPARPSYMQDIYDRMDDGDDCEE